MRSFISSVLLVFIIVISRHLFLSILLLFSFFFFFSVLLFFLFENFLHTGVFPFSLLAAVLVHNLLSIFFLNILCFERKSCISQWLKLSVVMHLNFQPKTNKTYTQTLAHEIIIKLKWKEKMRRSIGGWEWMFYKS